MVGNIVGFGVKPGWALPGCVTLDKILNLSEPQSITFLSPFPDHMVPPHSESSCLSLLSLKPRVPGQPPIASSVLPESSSSPPSPPCLPCSQVPNPVHFHPLNIGVAASPSGPSLSLLWSRPGGLSPGFVRQPSNCFLPPPTSPLAVPEPSS